MVLSTLIQVFRELSKPISVINATSKRGSQLRRNPTVAVLSASTGAMVFSYPPHPPQLSNGSSGFCSESYQAGTCVLLEGSRQKHSAKIRWHRVTPLREPPSSLKNNKGPGKPEAVRSLMTSSSPVTLDTLSTLPQSPDVLAPLTQRPYFCRTPVTFVIPFARRSCPHISTWASPEVPLIQCHLPKEA